MAAVYAWFYIRKVSCFEKTKYTKRCAVKSSTTCMRSFSYSSTFLSSKSSQLRHIKFWPCKNDFLIFLFHPFATWNHCFEKKLNWLSDAAWKALHFDVERSLLTVSFVFKLINLSKRCIRIKWKRCFFVYIRLSFNDMLTDNFLFLFGNFNQCNCVINHPRDHISKIFGFHFFS